MRVVGISGSLRKASTNTGLLRAVTPFTEGHEFIIADISKLPLFNEDLEVGGFPSEVEEFRNLVKSADAFIFASPDYNYGVTAPLKNAIDWASRAGNLWNDKVVALVSSGGGTAGHKSQFAVRQSGTFLNIHFVNKPEYIIRRFSGEYFNADGDLIHEESKARLQSVWNALIDLAVRFQKREN